MVSMKKHLYLLFIITVFYSCEENIDTLIIEKDIPPATEISSGCNISGQVVNFYGVPFENVELALYVDHEFERSFLTDDNGEYCIELTTSEIESYILLEASYEDNNDVNKNYSKVVRKARFDSNNHSELNYLILDNFPEGISNGDPEDRELQSVYGQIVDDNGVGGFGSVTFFDRPFQTTFATYADMDGVYEYFVYPDVEYDLLYYTTAPASLGVLQSEPEFQAYFYEIKDQIFPIEVKLDDFLVTREFSNRKIIGQVNYTNGDPLMKGSFHLDQQFVNSPIPIIDGKLYYNRNSCELFQDSYEAYIMDEITGQKTSPFTVLFEDGIMDIGSIKI